MPSSSRSTQDGHHPSQTSISMTASFEQRNITIGEKKRPFLPVHLIRIFFMGKVQGISAWYLLVIHYKGCPDLHPSDRLRHSSPSNSFWVLLGHSASHLFHFQCSFISFCTLNVATRCKATNPADCVSALELIPLQNNNNQWPQGKQAGKQEKEDGGGSIVVLFAGCCWFFADKRITLFPSIRPPAAAAGQVFFTSLPLGQQSHPEPARHGDGHSMSHELFPIFFWPALDSSCASWIIIILGNHQGLVSYRQRNDK